MADITTSLVSYWTLNDTANDSVGSNHGSLVGSPTYTTDAGRRAISLNGTSQTVSVPDAASLDMTTLTAAAWIKPNTVTGIHEIVSKWTSTGNQRGWLFTVSGDELEFWTSSTGATIAGGVVTTAANLTINTWHHVAATYTNGQTTAVMYVNGVSQSVTGTVASSIFNSTSTLRIGSLGQNIEWFSGLIDEVRLYSRALSAADVTELFEFTGVAHKYYYRV